MNHSSETVEDVTLVWKVVPCLLLIVGTIGNVLSLIVLCRKSMRKSRLTRYLICLSVADLLVVYTGVLPLYIKNVHGVDIRDSSSFLCKVLPWMLYFGQDMSAWILVSATLERSISVWKPHKVKLICTKKVTSINLISICGVLLLVNGHVLFGFNLLDTGLNKTECETRNNSNYEDFQDYKFPWVDLFIFCIGPFVFQLVGNTVIVVGLVRHSKTVEKYSIDRRGHSGKKDNVISSMTIMLLFLNVTFLLFTFPISIYFVRKDQWGAIRKDVFDATNLLSLVNNSTNFIAYIISGRRFRNEFWSIIRRGFLASKSRIMSRTSLSNSGNLGTSSKLSNSQKIDTLVSNVYSVSGHVS